MTTTLPNPTFEPAALADGQRLFTRPCTFLRGAVALDHLPDAHLPEIAFAGRSNVGKSSLINALTAHGGLARVSDTPGRTQEINFFELGNRLMILGYLDELHSFSADDVNRVAADLANENEAVDFGGPAGPANDHALSNQTATSARLDDIEGRLAKQEALTRRAGAIIQQFLTLISSEAP